MPSIRPLDPALINKIAAGEVIERPASVVKELLENAIDAGATRIDVTLEDGGASLIAVSDDGCGIAPDELPLAIAPHATSKIAGVDDLFDIRTMGFRGEALASIAAVSRLRIVSRTPDRLDGASLEAADADVSAVAPCAAPTGTTIEVRNLFYNLPARRKYLRTASAELGHITEQIARIALARPDVSLTQTHAARVMRKLPATPDRRARIADFYGAELAEVLIAFSRSEPDLRIEGLFAPPAESRANSRWQYCFLNGRFIRDRELTGFVFREAFRGLIEPARFPVVFLFLTADPAAFDVNVHPQKIEVRWRDAGRVKSQVLAVLREAILSRDLTPALRTPSTPVSPADARSNMSALAAQLRSYHPDPAPSGPPRAAPIASPPYQLRAAPPAEGPRLPYPSQPWSRATPAQRDAALQALRAPDAPVSDAARLTGDAASGPPAGSPDAGLNAPPASSADGPAPAWPGRAIQIHNTYLICETPEGVLIVDQHALHERIMYEELRKRIASGPLESQRLLLPETLDASPAQLTALDGAADVLARLGLEIEPFGPRSIAVRAAPSLLGDANVREFVADILDKLCETAHGPEALLNDIIAMMACKAAVKAGDPLSADLIDALLAQRHLVEKSSNCPHGRPTTLRLTVADLERQFKRT